MSNVFLFPNHCNYNFKENGQFKTKEHNRKELKRYCAKKFQTMINYEKPLRSRNIITICTQKMVV